MSRPVTFQYGSNKPFEVYVLKEMTYIGLIELKHTIAQLAGGDGSECFFIKKGDATLPLTAVYEDDGQQPLIVVFNGSVSFNNIFLNDMTLKILLNMPLNLIS